MALRHLSLRDFAIVSELDMEWKTGFSVLTGETGAGKSILIDALQAVLGGRGDALWVREGQPRCEIGAEFDLPATASTWLAEGGFDTGEDSVLLRRIVDASGKSRAWINGSPATITQLRTLGEQLVDIHGQHAWQSLTRAAAVRALLDAYAGVDMTPLQSAWSIWQQARAAVDAAQSKQQGIAAERERLLWQIGELERLAPQENEWDELDQQHTRLSHAQGLIDAAQEAVIALEGDGDSQGAALAALVRVQDTLRAHENIEPEFGSLLETLLACEAQMQDVAHSLQGYARRTDLDPSQLAALDERVSQWLQLSRRFHRQPAELPNLLTGWRAELTQLESAADVEQLSARARQAADEYQKIAQKISAARKRAAPRLASSVTEAMQSLGMAGGLFKVDLRAEVDPTTHGLENTHFLVAAHAGATPRALDRVASGGELSRLALAIAVTTSTLGPAATLVFDEIDTGVGGNVAATVGKLLQRLGRDRQVLCVTHLPQVAACADHHMQVSKTQPDSGEVLSSVAAVDGDARTREIARMLGSEQPTDATLAHAREMLALEARRHTLKPAADKVTPARNKARA